MRKALFAFAVLVVLFGGYGLAATAPPTSEPTTAPLQTLPPAGGASGTQVQIPELDPGLQQMFEPIERELRKANVSTGSPIVVKVLPPSPVFPPPSSGPCGDAPLGTCVLAYRISGAINVQSANELRDFMKVARGFHVAKLVIEITTDGGEVPAGHEMARDIENFPGQVICVADYHVASMGMYIFQSCDRRLMTRRASLMLHQVLTPVDKGLYNASSLLAKVRRVESLNSGYAEHVVAKTKVTMEEYLKKTRGREWYLNHADALKYGFVDVVTPFTPNKIFMGTKSGVEF